MEAALEEAFQFILLDIMGQEAAQAEGQGRAIIAEPKPVAQAHRGKAITEGRLCNGQPHTATMPAEEAEPGELALTAEIHLAMAALA